MDQQSQSQPPQPPDQFTIPVCTEAQMLAEARKHFSYWQGKLRMLDLDVSVRFTDDEECTWMRSRPNNGGSNLACVDVELQRSVLRRAWVTPAEVWSACCHELIHCMMWPMVQSFDPVGGQFTEFQLSTIRGVLAAGNEAVTYKLEAIFALIYAADSPTYNWSEVIA